MIYLSQIFVVKKGDDMINIFPDVKFRIPCRISKMRPARDKTTSLATEL